MARRFSPERSSSFDQLEDDSPASHNQWNQPQSHSQNSADPPSPDAEGDDADEGEQHESKNSSSPVQKRRRVTRACDECRRKKIKCDGKQPCTHCTVYSYDCTYDQPSNRRRNPAPQYIEALENRLQRAEALLRVVLPNVNLDDPIPDVALSRPTQAAKASQAEQDVAAEPAGSERDAMLESMVEATGQLDLDDQGHWDFRGHSSGLMFMRRMREQFSDLLGPDRSTTPFMRARPMSLIFDSPRSSADSPMDSALPVDLPPKHVAMELLSNALDDACALMRFVHQPSFYALVDRMYNLIPEHYGDEEWRFLPLLYMVLAVGLLFAKTEQSELDRRGYENAIERGFKFFKASRRMMDIAECRDLTSIQTVLFMIIFLQSSAKLSTCYSYIGLALRSALRMGLHRSIAINFDPIEREVRKRVFWMIRKMDTYVGAQLGLPKTLNDDDVDQDQPLEVDDEYITKDGILPMPEGKISLIAATNHHTKIVKILAKVIRHIYPIKGLERSLNGKTGHSYVVSQTRIREIERDLQQWNDELPTQLKSGGEAPPDLVRVQQLLRMSFAHTQMMLYRPFLHYVSQEYTGKTIDQRSYACAAACVSVSRNIIHITTEMKKRGLLIGSYWFTMYTTFFAILSLVFFALENCDNPAVTEMLKDAEEGRATLASLSKRSMAADRCTISLKSLFDNLPGELERGRKGRLNHGKKRAAPSPNPTRPVYSQSASNIKQPPMAKDQNEMRAATFPDINRAVADHKAEADRRWHKPIKVEEVPKQQGPSFDLFNPTPLPDSSGPRVETPVLPPQAGLPASQMMPTQQHPDDTGLLPDLSAMMFPSADPFAYPNQPMTMLEDRQFKRQDLFPQGFDSIGPGSSTGSEHGMIPGGGPNAGGGVYDDLEGQLFGPLPPYLLQGQQQQQQQQQGPVGAMPHLGSSQAQVVMQAPTTNNGFVGSQFTPGSPGINLDEIFNSDHWASMVMDQSVPGS